MLFVPDNKLQDQLGTASIGRTIVLYLREVVYFVNPRRACAARVTVVVLRESLGAFFSMKGRKRGEREEGSWGVFFSMKGGEG